MSEHKNPADRSHFWEHPATTHQAYPGKAATIEVVKDGVRKRVDVGEHFDAAVKAGWQRMPEGV